MALVVALKFDDFSGGIAIDQEAWHLRGRRSFFSDCLFNLLPLNYFEKFNLSLIYGGVGNPNFHYEVYLQSKQKISEFLENNDLNCIKIVNLAEIVLEAFQYVHRKKLNNKLKLLYNIDLQNIIENETIYKNKFLMEKIKNLILDKSKWIDSDFLQPNDAILIGYDKFNNYQAFCIKEKDGVLSYQSCGFDALGAGRYSAGIEFSNLLSNLFLSTRLHGVGKKKGLFYLLSPIVFSSQYFSQIGGNLHFIIIDGKSKNLSDKFIEISGELGKLAQEIITLTKYNLLPEHLAIDLLFNLVFNKEEPQLIEKQMLLKSNDFTKAELLLRGYKIQEEPLPSSPIIQQIYLSQESKESLNI